MAKRLLTTQRIVNLAADPLTGTAGEIYYNTVSNSFKYYDGSAWVALSAGGGSGNSFTTVDVPSGTDPVASSSSDTLTLTSSNGISITGNSSTDTIDFSTNATSLNTASTIVSRDADQAFDITAIDFDTTDTITSAVGRLTWDDGEGTLNFGLKGGNVNLQIGQENIALCYNGTGSTITKGSVVYISGAQGQRPSITLSDADTEATSSKTFGVAAENISNGAEGFVCTFGVVTGVDTSSFTAGQALWLSSTAGQLTNVVPTQPAHAVFVGYCLSVNATSGRIFVNPQNGYELQELHNVLINGIADNHILSYDNATSLWKNQGLAAAIQEVDGVGSSIDADLLDGQHGSHYLDWTNTTNKPDPTITLGGDLSGSVTLTDLTSGTLNASVADDSHNHTTSTITNFTEDVQDVVGGMVSSNTESGIAVTYDDVNGKLNFDVNDPTITLAGDITGSATMTNLGNVSITTTNTDKGSSQNIFKNVAVSGQSTIVADTNDDTLTVAAGTGITLTTNATTDTLTVTNAGVTGISGTTNQITASASTGSITLSLPSAVTFPGTVTLNADPTQDLQAATKQYVDAVAQGLHIHASCAAATTANITNLSTPPATIDGVTLTTSMRVLVKNQSTTSQNGIYVFNGTALVRATDFDSAIEIDGGDFVFVTGGTVNNDTGWVQTETVATVGTDPIVFTQFSGAGTYTAGNGLTLTGSQFSINTGVTADLSTAQTLTNKTINGANNTLTVRLANDITGFGTGVATFLATPTSSNLAAAITDETGTGSLVFANTPTLVTPNIGAATGTSLIVTSTLNASGAITSSATSGRVSLGVDAGGSISLGRIDNNATTPYIDFNSGSTTVDFDVRIQASGGNGEAGNGILTVTGVLATEASTTGHAGLRLPHGTAPTAPTNGDIWTTTSGLFARINGATQQYAPTSGTLAQFAATTSAQLAGVISDETGSGSLVFATSPTLVTPTLGVATATSINKVTVTAPTTSATLTLADGSTLATSGAFSITLTATATTNVTLPTSGTLATTTQALQWDGGSTSLVAATGRTSLGATTVGSNIFTLTNPSAITFLKINADNTVTAESSSTFKTSLSLNNVENTAISTWTGSNNINTIGATTIDSNAFVDATSTSITANTETTIDTTASATYRSAEYIVQVTQGTKYTVSKLIMIHDGTTAHITEYSLIELGASRIPLTISGTLSGGNILLQATITDAATTNATAKVFKTAIVV